MNLYNAKNPVHDRTYMNKIQNFSCNITITSLWIKLLKDFNTDKYNNMLRFLNHSGFFN